MKKIPLLTSLAVAAPAVKNIHLGNYLESKFPDDPVVLVQGIITWLLGFAGAFAVIAIVWSGVMYITAGGDPAKAETAKKNLIWAITGIVVILLAYVIIQWVGNILNYGTTVAPAPAPAP